MTTRITSRTVIERFASLKASARLLAKPAEYESVLAAREVELHDAALSYAAAVRKVARRNRDK